MRKSAEDQRIVAVEGTLAEAVRRLCLTDRRVLAAVSGGADSLCLLVGLHRLGVKVEAACIDHGLRAESAAEVEMVASLCRRLGVPFHSATVQVEGGRGIEAAARIARYAALEAIRARQGLDVVATGHTASDQAETVLMRLGRGATLQGVAGILEARADGIVRPLLAVSRQETQAYLAALDLTASSDPMNRDLSFARVRVRREVLPALVAALGPGVERALARFAGLAREDEALLAEEAKRALARVSLEGGALDRVALLSSERPVQRRVLAMFLEQASIPIDAALIERCLLALRARRRATLPLDRVLVERGGAVGIERTRPRRKAD